MPEIKPYIELVKIDEKSNKIYKIFIEYLNKGDNLATNPPKVTNKECYQVYIQSGKIDGILKTHFYRSFFSYTAAKRFAKGILNSKLHKKYRLKQNEESFSMKKEIEVTDIEDVSKETFLPVFDVLSKPKYQITRNEKSRFSKLFN